MPNLSNFNNLFEQGGMLFDFLAKRDGEFPTIKRSYHWQSLSRSSPIDYIRIAIWGVMMSKQESVSKGASIHWGKWSNMIFLFDFWWFMLGSWWKKLIFPLTCVVSKN